MFFWLDTETTGLNPEGGDRLLEVAAIVTDSKLNVLDTYQTAIYQPPEVLSNLHEKVVEMHTKNGLFDAVRRSILDEFVVEDGLVRMLLKHTTPGVAVLAGNSVHFDARFVRKYMPRLLAALHYRIFDVSSVKIASQTLGHGEAPKPEKKHRGLDDIRDSIEEWRWYATNVFKEQA